jgi:hypothetical protein
MIYRGPRKGEITRMYRIRTVTCIYNIHRAGKQRDIRKKARLK